MKHSFLRVKTIFLMLIFVLAINKFIFANENMAFSWSLNEIYDDNITYIKNNKKQDLITKISLKYDAKLAVKKSLFEFSGNINQNLFSKYSKNNYTSQSLNLNYQYEVTQFVRINLSDSYYHTYEPRSFEDSFDKFGGRYNLDSNKLYLEYSQDITGNFIVSSKILNETNNYSKSYTKNNNYLNSLELKVNYIISPALDLNIFLNFSKRSFLTGEDSFSDDLSVDLIRFFTKSFFLEGATGINNISSYSKQKFTKPFFSCSIAKVNEKGEMRLSFLNEFTSSSYSKDLLNQLKVTAKFNRQLSEKFILFSSIFYGYGKYIIFGVKDENIGTNLGFEYELTDNLKSTISYSLSQIKSNLDIREYTKNTINFGVNGKF